MRLQFYSICIALLLFSCVTNEVDPLISKHLYAWKVDKEFQYDASREIFSDLIAKNDSSLFKKEVEALYLYLSKYPDKKIEAHTILYHVVGANILNLSHQPGAELLEYAVILAEKLNDDILSAQIYSYLSSLFGNDGIYLFYSFKSIEILEKLGVENFQNLYKRYFEVSIILYNAKEYAKSIELAKKSLNHINHSKQQIDSSFYIQIYDVLGNNYLKIQEVDSAKKYFIKGKNICETIEFDKDYTTLWNSIYNGNLGRIEFLEGRIDSAYIHIQQHFYTAQELKDSLNIVIAATRLGDLFYHQKDYSQAEKYYSKAMEIGEKIKKHELLTYSADQLTNIHLFRKDYKKALENELISDSYTEVHQKYLDLVNLNRLHALQNIEKIQVELEKSKSDLEYEKNKRINLTYFFIFLAIITITILLRMRMKNKHHLLMTKKENESLAMEMSHANAQISNFKKNIIEKNSLIEHLNLKLSYSQKIDLHQSLVENTLITEDEWEKFKFNFLKVYPHSTQIIKEFLPQPTPAEQRLLCLLILGLETQQIGNALGISRDSVARSKRRLRNRLQNSSGMDIENLISKILNK